MCLIGVFGAPMGNGLRLGEKSFSHCEQSIAVGGSVSTHSNVENLTTTAMREYVTDV
ncbi:hypothetical protein FRC0546_00071 [Corynebacterium diphtheriae]|nr:hypothetical protein CIP102550_00049 [Corynebacterium diphtheriae]CAB0531810.1 hypothetical protein CIP107518_00037 [Corynebacterium diphtheriae]CAB0578188.1 hypothetical protein CIP107550_00051 [Corynebacterium diphtheriae]CAB1027196.1 hypothetical protein FRC0551_00021 [Corynebacterium diphtheriae]CAB1027291.1 hypothetical protein FRC0552_00024 [Corynebacterium diphtheriae]